MQPLNILFYFNLFKTDVAKAILFLLLGPANVSLYFFIHCTHLAWNGCLIVM